MARVLDDAGVFSAVLSIGSPSWFGSSAILDQHAKGGDEEFRARLEDGLEELPPSPFSAVGIGWSADDDGAVITIAYQHASEADASANADALETLLREGTSYVNPQPLAELYDLQGIETDGAIAVVTVRPGPRGDPSTVFDALRSQDALFIHR